MSKEVIIERKSAGAPVVVPELATGMARSRRQRPTFEIAGGGFVATGATDAAVDKVREWVRYRVAFYGSTPAYYPVLDAHGLRDLGLKLNRMTRDGAWDRMAAEIPDDVLDLFVVSGRHDQIADAIEQRFGGAVDTIYASASSEEPGDMPPDLLRDLARIATPFMGFETLAPTAGGTG